MITQAELPTETGLIAIFRAPAAAELEREAPINCQQLLVSELRLVTVSKFWLTWPNADNAEQAMAVKNAKSCFTSLGLNRLRMLSLRIIGYEQINKSVAEDSRG